MMAQIKRNLLNVALFQFGWFVCVQGHVAWALATTALVLLLHARFLVRDAREWLLLIAVAALGFVVDSVMIRAGILVPQPAALLAPLWLVCLWLLLATTLAHSLAWLQRRVLFAAVLGAIGGPLAYIGGAQFGAALLGDDGFLGASTALVVLSLSWAVAMPLLLWLTQQLLPQHEVSA